MKTIFKTFIGLFIAGSLVSCEDYLDVNTDPINPTAESVNPDLLLAGALTGPYDAQYYQIIDGERVPISGANELGNVMMNNWASNVNSYTGGYQDEFRLNVTSDLYSNIWNETYRSLRTLQLIINDPSGEYEKHRAIAMLMKAYYFQMLVDLYGDIPYSESLQFVQGNFSPVYDDDKLIYRDLVETVDQAISIINNADEVSNQVGSEDVIFQGDLSQWVRFGNTLKLRLLVRQMTLAETDGETKSYLQAEFAELEQNFLMENMVINPGYVNATGQQNPFYEQWGYDSEDNPTVNRLATVAADYATEFLQGQQPNNPNVTQNIATGIYDPRVQRLYQPLPEDSEVAPNEVVGVVQGADNTTAPKELSLIGPGIINSATQPGMIIQAAQSYFLQAEAAYRGYIAGDAKELFQQGIIASFETLFAGTEEDAEDLAQAYIQASNNVERIGWDGSSNKIRAIMTQKWIATNGLNAQESWIEYLRTGYPETPLSVIAQRPAKPNRLMYPGTEYASNATNVPDQTTEDAFGTSVFWDVTN